MRRLLTLAIYDYGTRSEAGRIGGVPLDCERLGGTVQRSRPNDLIDGKAPGALPLLSAEQRHALLRIVERGPIPASHSEAVRRDHPMQRHGGLLLDLLRPRAVE